MSIPLKILSMALIAMVAAAALAASGAAQVAAPIESPALAEMVQARKLPPQAERLPSDPRIVKVSRPGRHGGTLRVVFGRSKDTRIMVVYGYARLVTYDQAFNLKPDILAGIDVQEGRIFTLRLRKGHRWSDGAPFTAEDFRYYL